MGDIAFRNELTEDKDGVYGSIVQAVKEYVAVVTNKIGAAMPCVGIMNTDDADKIASNHSRQTIMWMGRPGAPVTAQPYAVGVAYL